MDDNVHWRTTLFIIVSTTRLNEYWLHCRDSSCVQICFRVIVSIMMQEIVDKYKKRTERRDSRWGDRNVLSWSQKLDGSNCRDISLFSACLLHLWGHPSLFMLNVNFWNMLRCQIEQWIGLHWRTDLMCLRQSMSVTSIWTNKVLRWTYARIRIKSVYLTSDADAYHPAQNNYSY